MASIYAEKINQEIDTKFESKWGKPEAVSSFHNKKATITIVYYEMNGEDEMGRIGVQLEGGDFRVYAGPSQANSKLKNENELFNQLIKLGWLEEYDKSTREVFGRKTSMTLPYRTYKTNKETHVFHYWNLTQGEDPMTDIKERLLMAKEKIDSKKLTFK